GPRISSGGSAARSSTAFTRRSTARRPFLLSPHSIRGPGGRRPCGRREHGRPGLLRRLGEAGSARSLDRAQLPVPTSSVPQDAVVVEREIPGPAERYPRGGLGIVAAHRRPAPPPHQEGDGRGGFPWVTVRAGVDPDQGPRASDETRLLPKLANDGGLHGLVELDEPPGQGPSVPERRTSATDKEDLSPSEPHRIDRQRRVLIGGAHGPRNPPSSIEPPWGW